MNSESEESTEHFFTSFTDLLVGVIFLFIILLMVFAIDIKKPKPEPSITSEQIRANILNEIAARMQAQDMPIVLDPANGVIRLPESLLFASGQWELLPQGKLAVEALAKVLADVLPCAAESPDACAWQPQSIGLDSVLIEGHTDNRPFAGAGGLTNWELSAFRAISVYKTMTEAAPVLASAVRNRHQEPLLGISAYADRRPVSTEALDPNRRIDVRFNMRADPPAQVPQP